MRARSSGPAAGYARRNHSLYSCVARTTSPCSVGVVVYVSRGGALCPSGRLPNASRSSRSFNLSRLGVTVGVPCGGKVAPVYRLQPAGLYVALPVTSTLSGAADAGNEVTHSSHTKNEEEGAHHHNQRSNQGLGEQKHGTEACSYQGSGRA